MSNSMPYDVAFLGGLFPKETEQEIEAHSKGTMQIAANVLQWKLVRGLDANLNNPVKIINSLYIGSYPKRYKKLFIKSYKFKHTSGAEDINVGFINLCGAKQIFRGLSLKKYLRRWALDGKENKVIIAYAMTNVFVKSLKYIKKINPEIKTCMVVPDLPQYMNTSDRKSPIYSFLKDISIKSMEKDRGYIDNFVLLTKQMSKALKVDNYVVVEGIADRYTEQDNKEKDIHKTVLYTGTLNKRYGILNLVKAFSMIKDSDYRLVLCGTGDGEAEIRKMADIDNRIVLKGRVPNAQTLSLQARARVVVNPRQNNEEFVKYSFPSKNMEYLASGTPLIAYKLDGIPDEYDDFIYYVKDDTVESLKNTIEEVCSKTDEELRLFGEQAKRFVLENKNEKVQALKILQAMGVNED